MKSTFAPEKLACSACLDILFLLSSLLREMVGTTIRATVRTGCASLFYHIYLQKAVTEKRVLIELAVIRDAIQNGEVTNPCDYKKSMTDSYHLRLASFQPYTGFLNLHT